MDRDHIIAAEGNGKKNYDGKPISPEMEQFIEARGCQVADAQEKNCKMCIRDSGSNYAKAKAGIAIADNINGPYKLVGSYMLASDYGNHGFRCV